MRWRGAGMAEGALRQSRDEAIAAFIAATGRAGARRVALAGDASMRRYERIHAGGQTAILMDAPPGSGEDVGPFVAIARHLRAIGLSAPEILAEDRGGGLLMLEDLGDDLYARILAAGTMAEAPIYGPAIDVLAHLQAAAAPPGLPDWGVVEMSRASCLAVEWYARAAGAAQDPAPLGRAVAEALAAVAEPRAVVVLRDYHAENLIWLPGREGLARVGLLDFQNAEMGQAGYDLVSLVQDARRDVAPETAAAMVLRFAAATGREHGALLRACAALGAQRALRIIGVFARLWLRDGKPGYLRLIPRVWGQLQRNLTEPELGPLARVVAATLPEPSDAVLSAIRDRCTPAPPR